MENQVAEIKQKLNIVDVISRFLPIKKRGRHFLACCPFHNEKTPSFTISPELQIFKCFGCGKAGDVFTFLEEYEKIDFREALEQLAKLAGVTLIKSEQSLQADSLQKRLIAINQECAKFYHYILTQHPLGKKALDYVLGRGITLETIKTFQIGFSPPNSQLISQYLSKKDFKMSDLLSTGSFGQSRYHSSQVYDRFQDRLVFPLFDYRDRILGFSGRILPTATNPNLAKYINSPETEIYHKSQMLFGLNLTKEAIKKNNSVLITEGEFDMISPFQKGIKNIVAIKGTAFTQEQLQLLRRYTDNLILALDSDFAGNSAAQKSIELADNLEFDIRVLSLGEKYKDPDEAVRGDFAFFEKQLKNTLPIWDFIIQSAIKNYGTETDKNIRNIINTVLPFLTKINSPAIRSEYFRKLAFQIGVSEDSIYEESKKHNTFSPVLSSTTEIKNISSQEKSKLEKLEEYLLTLIFGAKSPIIVSKKIKKHISFSNLQFNSIFQTLISQKKFEPKEFQESLPTEIRPIFQTIFINASNLTLESSKRFLEIKKITNQINSIVIKSQLVELSRKISQLENSDSSSSELENLETSYNQLLHQLSSIQNKKA